MTKMLLSSLALVTLLVLAGCDDKEGIKSEVISQKRDTEATKFSLELTDGHKLKVDRHEKGLHFEGEKGKVVLLNFFATWCPPCKAEIPHLVNLKSNYKDQFEVVGVLMEDSKTKDEIQKFIDTFDINFKIAISNENQKLAKALGGVKSIPFMILYDPQGNYFTHYVGAVPEEMIEFDIKRAMEKR